MTVGKWLTSMTLIDTLNPAESLTLWPGADNGSRMWVIDWDPGYPNVRRNSEDRAAQDGTNDYTTYFGERAVSLVVKVLDTDAVSPYLSLQELRAWCRPGREVTLQYEITGDTEVAARLMFLKGTNIGAQLAMTALRSGNTDVQLQWVCPRGVEESSTVYQYIAPRFAPVSGRAYIFNPPRDYPDQTANNTTTLVNDGTIEAWPIIKVYGPCLGPRIVNVTTGRTIELTNLSLDTGEYAEIDMREKTIQKNGIPGSDNNLRSMLTVAQWWSVPKGNSQMAFFSTTGIAPTQAVLTFRRAFI